MAEILEILPTLRDEIGAIPKGHDNAHFGYKFRSVEDVLRVCGPAFNKHGVTPAIKVSEHRVQTHVNAKGKNAYHAALLMTVTLTARDGSQVEFTAAGEGLDNDGDKATYKAMSGAYKYALLLGLSIPVDKRSVDDPGSGRKKSPAAEGNPIDKARKAIATADAKRLARFKEEITDRIGKGEYTAEETKILVWALNQRANELKVPNGKVEQNA